MKDKESNNWNEEWDREFEEGVFDSADDSENGEKPEKIGSAIVVFLVLIVLAAVVCAVLWFVTHQKDDAVVVPGNESSVVDYVSTSVSESDEEETAEPMRDANKVITSDGREIVFSDCDNYVTPKEYVNLRTEPSTAGGETTVFCQANAGEVLHRTGISPDFGWSRLEYQGQILYVVSGNVEATEE